MVGHRLWEHESDQHFIKKSGKLAMDHPIIDSHIHLYEASDLPRLNWGRSLPTDHVLARTNNVSDYKGATRENKNVLGFVFIETDRTSGLEPDQWNDALEEVGYLAGMAQADSDAEEGDGIRDARFLLGVVPWAPIPAGPTALAKYVHQALQPFPEGRKHLVKGFRYLVQDKPPGTMLRPEFVESLLWLGQHGFSFDLGVDARSVGLHQLEEFCELLKRICSERSQLKVIINHFCKPNLRLSSSDAIGGHQDFTRWKACIERMAGFECTYMKLSGFFSELPPQTEADPADIPALIAHIRPWIEVVFGAFTPSRILFGSDWPVCNVGGPGREKSWQHWRDLAMALLDTMKLTSDEQAMVWAGTAVKAYNIVLNVYQ